MSEPSPKPAGDTEQYEIRPYGTGDRADVLSLFETVWETDRSEEWLVGSFEQNPDLDGSPVVVADTGDAVVGARPFVPFPMQAGSTAFTAVLLNNAMVHPDHRRRGLFTRMMEEVVRTFEAREASFLFNFANHRSTPAYRKLGFDVLGTGPRKSLRLQHPGRYVRERLDVPGSQALAAAAETAVRGYHGLKRLTTPRATGWRVERRAGIPAAELSDLYERDPPDRLHTRREASLYRWLEPDPYWNYETYLASPDASSSPSAAAIVRTPVESPSRLAEIVDAVPPAPSGSAAFPALLDAVLAAHETAPSIAVTGPVVNEHLFPPELLSRFGFHSSQGPLLSRFTVDEDTVFAHVFEDAADRFDTHGLTALENWLVRVS